ncbi:MAG: hypothetical protein A2X64_06875 [Ignavibacteria bacterium GWF2_33_9]|nr:MAG: hypothetical protein A2X64_06875 [Ignavibacteria bacterium GWF2_33_9]
MGKEQENNLQARRVTYITNQLMQGKTLTVKGLHEHFVKEYSTLTTRTIQRDLRLIQEIIPTLEDSKKGRQNLWKIPRRFLTNKGSYLSANELLSIYFLKAYLKLFKGTIIEEQVNILTEKIEKMAPDDIISNDVLFNDKNIGYFDYSDFDPLIRKVIRLIREKKVVRVEYEHYETNSTKEMEVVFEMFFTNSEMLYVIVYNIKHEAYIVLSLQRIVEIQETENKLPDKPEFNYNEWAKGRFGVYWGEQVEVEI